MKSLKGKPAKVCINRKQTDSGLEYVLMTVTAGGKTGGVRMSLDEAEALRLQLSLALEYYSASNERCTQLITALKSVQSRIRR
jgi:hypothetical protein